MRVYGLVSAVLVLAVLVVTPFASALTLFNVTVWQWSSDTVIGSVAAGDVDGDGADEIVTGGTYRDSSSSHYFAQLCVWSGSSLALENVNTWEMGVGVESPMQEIASVALGDVDADGALEIVTGGYYYDGTRVVAQLRVWSPSGSSLALENDVTWYWTSNTVIESVAVSDVDGDGQKEIVTGGDYYTGDYFAQLCVWSPSGSSLALENVETWAWGTGIGIHSVAVGNVDVDEALEIVTGGDYYDGIRRVAQLCVWSGSSLALENVNTWYWTDDTDIRSVAVGDLDILHGPAEIVTGGEYYDGTRYVAQLCVWNGATLAVRNVQTWYWASGTFIESVAIASVVSTKGHNIVTGGSYWDGSVNVAQLCTWSSSLALASVVIWDWGSGTYIESVAGCEVDADVTDEVVTGGTYYFGYSLVAQLCVWA